MKRAIVTPTYVEHFCFIKKYLRSCAKYIEDKADITLVFTISRSEVNEFNQLIQPYANELLIQVVLFEDLLKKYNVAFSSEELLRKYDRFSFQTLKKFYTLLFADFDQMLVLDSESMFIKPTNVNRLFDDFYKKPFISMSNTDELICVDPFRKDLISNINYILNLGGNYWFLENFVWFYDKQIIVDLANEYGTPIKIVEKIYKNAIRKHINPSCFEINLFQGFIFKNADKYGYEVINVMDKLKQYLGTDMYNRYMTDYFNTYNGGCGVLERAMIFLNDENVDRLASMFYDLRYNVIRCEVTNIGNYWIQSRFLNIAQPSILAASQHHMFGCNNTLKTRIRHLVFDNNNDFSEVKYWTSVFLRPFKPIINWGLSIPKGVKRLVIYIYHLFKNIKMILLGI